MTIKLLAIESATDVCSVALRINEHSRQKSALQPRIHSELILPMVDELLTEAGIELKQLDAIAFGCGPGSFTGLRIASAMVQGLAFGSSLPVVAVSSLAVLAQTAMRKHGIEHLVTAIDARMKEIYWAVYSKNKQGLMTLNGQETVCMPEEAILDAENVTTGVGNGGVYFEVFKSRNPQLIDWRLDCVPEAIDLLDLAEAEYFQGRCLEPDQAAPVYLREATNWKKLPGR